jgi:hypothetical protein
VKLRREFWLKALVSGVALLLLLLHWLPSRLNFDLTTWILIGLFAVPWLVNALPKVLQYIHTAEIGTLRLEFQDQVRDIKSRQEEIKSNQEKQREELDRLKIIVNLLVTEEEFKHLQRFISPDRWTFDKNAWTNKFFEQELRRLRAVKLITGRTGKGISTLFKEGGDVKNHLQITDEGVKFIAFRNQVNEPQAETSNPAD